MDESTSHPSGEDSEYVARCKNGDVDAFQALVERYQRKVINIAYRMTGDYDDACEIAQEAFLSAYRALKNFRGEAKFSTWLTGITINHAKNRLRQLQTRAHHETVSIDDPSDSDSGSAAYDPPAEGLSALEQLEQREVQEMVQGCISALNHEYREVLVLRDIEGYSYEEIHRALTIPEGTIKSRLFRARDSVKDCLKRALGDT